MEQVKRPFPRTDQDKFYNALQRRGVADYPTILPTLTNRQLLKEERLTRELLTEVQAMKASGSKYHLGRNIDLVLYWEQKYQELILKEVAARGYVWKKDKYVNVKTKTI